MNRRRGLRRVLQSLIPAALILALTLPQPAALAQAAEQPPARAAASAAPGQVDGPAVVSEIRNFAPRKDAVISSASPNSNFGSSSTFSLGWQAGGREAMRMLLAFDLSSIPSNAVITRATLNIYQYSVIPGNDSGMVFRAQQMSQDWDEYGVTWNNANYLGGAELPLGTIPPIIGNISGDATALVRSWVSGATPNHGLLITGDEVPANNRQRYFYTRESGAPPYITVEYEVACDTLPPVANMLSQPQFQPLEFRVEWTATDQAPAGCPPVGVATYDVEYRVDFGGWVPWQSQTGDTAGDFESHAADGAYVEFRVRATDNAGNMGAFTGPQAATTIDSQPPTATVNPLPEYTLATAFPVSWSGNDGAGSGIATYDVQFRVDDGPWQTLVEGTSQTSYQVTGAQDFATYSFRTRATDRVGNAGQWPDEAQATTTVFTKPVAKVNQFDPAVIKPTAPITDSFAVSWVGATPPGTSLTWFTVSYQYNNGPWTPWQSFPASQTQADFPWQLLGLGDGFYSFNAVATNNQNVTGEFVAIPAVVIVDMADQFRSLYLPLAAQDGD